MRCEDQRPFRHAFHQAGDCAREYRRPFIGPVIEHVYAVFVDQAEMHVKSVAGPGAVWLGHKGGRKLVLPRDPFDQSFEQHRIVRRLQRIGRVPQIDFELPDTVLGECRIRRKVLFPAFFVDVPEKFPEIVKFIDRKESVGIEALAGIG